MFLDDETAIDIYNAAFDGAFRVIRGTTADSMNAEDIATDVVIEFLMMNDEQGPENNEGFAYRSGKNKAIDSIRRENTFRDKVSLNVGSLMKIRQGVVRDDVLSALRVARDMANIIIENTRFPQKNRDALISTLAVISLSPPRGAKFAGAPHLSKTWKKTKYHLAGSPEVSPLLRDYLEDADSDELQNAMEEI